MNLSDLNGDCYFFNDPILNLSESIDFIKSIIESQVFKKTIIMIFVNCNKDLFNLFDESKCIDSYYINNIKGYSIYRFNKE